MTRRPGSVTLADLGPEPCDLFLSINRLEQGTTSKGKPYLALELGDAGGGIEARVWHDTPGFEEVAGLEAGAVVKVRGRRGEYKGTPQLVVDRIRPLGEDDEPGYDPARVHGPFLEAVADLACASLVIDIETAPLVDVRGLPQKLVEEVTRVATDRDWDIDKVLGLNPLFSRVVSIALGDADGAGGTVLLAPPDDEVAEVAGAAPGWMRVLDERTMLGSFWALAARATLVVTYNGRGFDLPFLRTRSAILGVPVVTDLVSQPPYQHRPHLDLYQVLIGQGRGAAPMNLDAACFAFGIESPKDAMDGSMVGRAYRDRRYEDIARYNLADIEATRALYARLADTVLPWLGGR
ncbi:MAG: ribonuclease H-like domain-containing protein [Planctomycetota bacterium]